MVTTFRKSIVQTSDSVTPEASIPDSLETWLNNPLKGTEWVSGRLVEKADVTLTHSKVQRRLSTAWANYLEQNGIGGEVYTEAPCQTGKQGRKPDVAYLTQSLLEQYGEPKSFPQSFPLIAEVVSPTDLAEEIYKKADEYLASGAKEVWLIFPDNYRVVVITAETEQTLKAGEIIKTQLSLPGFSIAVDKLLA